MTDRPCLFVVLAAGEGTRMRSAIPKVMHPVANEPMIGHVLASVGESAGDNDLAVVVGPDMDAVSRFVENHAPKASVHVQSERLGTAHAVLSARDALTGDRDVVVLFGDTPLVTSATLDRMRAGLSERADIVVLGFEAGDPTGYGRLIMDGDRVIAIREHSDATDEERRIKYCNSGAIAFRNGLLPELLDAIGNENVKKEHYLTDAIAIAAERGMTAVAMTCSEDEVRGVNTRTQLAAAEAVMQDRLRAAALAGGATMVAPETVFLSRDTRIGYDVLIEPNVYIGRGCSIGDRVTIRAFCHFEGATIAADAIVGPFARFRPQTAIGEAVRIGNFVEVKASTFEKGAKANHLSYIGDTRVGPKANIGAGTITCNYDGEAKHRTDIGAGAFIGSNSSLVAPVKIGDGAYIASGSVITEDVEPDALAFGRARQKNKPGRARRRADRMTGKPNSNDS